MEQEVSLPLSKNYHLSPFWLNSVYAQSYFLKIHFIIIFQSKFPSSKWSSFLLSLHQNPTCNSSVSKKCYMPRPSHSSWKDQQNIRWKIHVMKLLFIWSSPIPLLRPSYPKISSAPSFPRTPSSSFPPSIYPTNPYSQTKQQSKYNN